MYVPKLFRNENLAEVRDFLHRYSFGIVVSQVEGRPFAAHIPLELDQNAAGQDVLTGHLSIANPIWKALSEYEGQVLAIFQGPNTYISSTWYNHENVPTWNYTAVHVYGKVRLQTADEVYISLKKMVDKYEAITGTGLKVENYSAGFMEKQMKGLVGFEIAIEEIQAAYKLSQNRDEESHANVVKALQASGDPEAQAVAKLMEK
jgi:transcriptional regulator